MPQPVDIQTDENARWATRFQDATTNLAQRQRYARDITAGDELTARRDEVAQERFLQSKDGAGARDLMAKRATIRRGMESSAQGADRIGIDRERLTAQQKRDDIAAKRFALEETQKADRHLIDSNSLQLAQRVQDQTTAATLAHQRLELDGYVRGSKEYAHRAARIIIDNPFANKTAIDTLKGDAEIDEDIDQIKKHFKPDEIARGTTSRSENGKWRFSVGPKPAAKPVDEAARIEKELHNANAALDSIYYQDTKDAKTPFKLKPHIGEAGETFYKGKQAAAMKAWTDFQAKPKDAPAVAADVADTRPIFKDAGGNRAYKNPDGSFEPVK